MVDNLHHHRLSVLLFVSLILSSNGVFGILCEKMECGGCSKRGISRKKREQKENHLIAKQMVLFFVAVV